MSPSALKYAACSILFSLSSPAFAETDWPDTPVGRLAVLAVIQDLNVQLLSHDSATLTLERWCDDHRLADPARISATRLKDSKDAPEDVRKALNVSAGETLGYRHVLLKCGNLVLSEADNWYVPRQLTSEMNETLNSSDAPFGKVVMPLHFQRHTISSQMLWRPLPDNWTIDGAMPEKPGKSLEIPDSLISNRALLSKPDGTPISFVIENYKSDLLKFPPPAISQ